ncbi:PREDICTED: LOW QUALITY PROTEIN: RNA-binding protein BRN1-like [Tarenaya hassleriana]|uniref:LOW QUALITY PROTEIN: RNA-binding protein BRN1-like n=1 Tax=Tarenaya hassleriana TaxID=28532 RepID=UPI00053C936F|nr:PREDICTED: LOW QUALITY PROTEIN: RNA-binding protein BRN1-like [Tarenaya hassleriana]
MAEEMMENRKSEESVKLFVGQVPKHMTEAQLLALFQEFAIVDEVNIIKDKTTRASRGCCFLICPSREEADKAVNACHNKKTLPGASSPLQVKYADGELERLEHKLFVGMLPKNVAEAEVLSIFSQYGIIKDLQILRGSQQTSKGCAFLKYETKEQAVAAMEAINGKHKMEGSNVPLVVKWADTEKERQARRLQKVQSQATRLANTDPQNPSLFGALPMSYVPPYNGYGYHGPGTYGYMLPPMQNHAAFHNMISPNQGNNALRGVSSESVPPRLARKNFPMPPANYMGSGYPAVPGLRYPIAYPRGMISPRALNPSPGSVSPAVANSGSSTSSGAGTSSGVQAEGPAGANLFIYNIPREYGDQELATAFQPFGRVLSAKVFVDKATGVSKCFGFVSYDSEAAAQNAINMMNGRQLGGKKLKVQLKRDNNSDQQQQQQQTE